jgi:hypothetical protein
MDKGDVIKLVKDVNGDEIPEEMIGDYHYVLRYHPDGGVVEHEGKEYIVYNEEVEVLTEEEVKDLLWRKAKTSLRRMLEV